ncbi:MAG: hypothetical protein ACYTGE_12805, partial [Planctomycetota bacterium]
SVFLSVRDTDKPQCVEIARSLVSMGFRVYTTQNTRDLLRSYSVDTLLLRKISEGARPNIVDKLASGEIDLIINTPTRKGAQTDEGRIRAMAVGRRVPMITTLTGARAAVQAIAALRAGAWSVAAVQDYAPHTAREPVGLGAGASRGEGTGNLRFEIVVAASGGDAPATLCLPCLNGCPPGLRRS